MSEPEIPSLPAARTSRRSSFKKGNPGRKRGSKNRATLLWDALARDALPHLLEIAKQKAADGDTEMLRTATEPWSGLSRSRIRPLVTFNRFRN